MAKYHGGPRQQELCDWLAANGVNPHVIPIDADLTISAGPDGARVIHYEACVFDDGGAPVRNERGTDVAVEKRTAPLLVEPPAWWKPFEKPTRDQVIAECDGAYRERAHLCALLAALYPSVIAPAPDVDEDGWQILYLAIGGKQASWHIAPRDAELYAHVEHVPADDSRAQWDGHTTAEKYGHLWGYAVKLVADAQHQIDGAKERRP